MRQIIYFKFLKNLTNPLLIKSKQIAKKMCSPEGAFHFFVINNFALSYK
jgi:hypothetical protein